MSDEAIKEWQKTYSTPHLRLDRAEPVPFSLGKRLGGGGVGEVHVTKIGNVPLALKRIYTKHVTEAALAEVKIMQQLTKDRHHHIAQLIGSYQKRQGGEFELGLLIWPVATCDLSVLLLQVDTLASWIASKLNLCPCAAYDEEDVECAIEILAEFRSENVSVDVFPTSALKKLSLFHVEILDRLARDIGCITYAVKWLHDNHIRHKDLKPSQILLSPQGLWLTDFGWAMDTSDMTQSKTVGGKTTTPKYLAPERALKQPCGRPEDIFGLGCIFLEIGYQLTEPYYFSPFYRAPWFTQDWLFSDNIAEARSQLSHHLKSSSRHMGNLQAIVWAMLAFSPEDRPSIDDVLLSLREDEGLFIGLCCYTRSNAWGHRAVSPSESTMCYQDTHTHHRSQSMAPNLVVPDIVAQFHMPLPTGLRQQLSSELHTQSTSVDDCSLPPWQSPRTRPLAEWELPSRYYDVFNEGRLYASPDPSITAPSNDLGTIVYLDYEACRQSASTLATVPQALTSDSLSEVTATHYRERPDTVSTGSQNSSQPVVSNAISNRPVQCYTRENGAPNFTPDYTIPEGTPRNASNATISGPDLTECTLKGTVLGSRVLKRLLSEGPWSELPERSVRARRSPQSPSILLPSPTLPFIEYPGPFIPPSPPR